MPEDPRKIALMVQHTNPEPDEHPHGLGKSIDISVAVLPTVTLAELKKMVLRALYAASLSDYSSLELPHNFRRFKYSRHLSGVARVEVYWDVPRNSHSLDREFLRVTVLTEENLESVLVYIQGARGYDLINVVLDEGIAQE